MKNEEYTEFVFNNMAIASTPKYGERSNAGVVGKFKNISFSLITLSLYVQRQESSKIFVFPSLKCIPADIISGIETRYYSYNVNTTNFYNFQKFKM